MKKLSLFAAGAALILSLIGCQQAQKMQADAAKVLDDASKQVETAKTQVIDAKTKIDEKVTQAQQAADAIKKLGE